MGLELKRFTPTLPPRRRVLAYQRGVRRAYVWRSRVGRHLFVCLTGIETLNSSWCPHGHETLRGALDTARRHVKT